MYPPQAFGNGTVTTSFNDLYLSQPGFEPTTFYHRAITVFPKIHGHTQERSRDIY